MGQLGDGKIRCAWCEKDQLYIDYHDNEWGRPVHDDQMLFEMLLLEGAQAGLSWHTILKRRETYRLAFDNFDARSIANYNDKKRAELLNDPGIIRNRLKVDAFISNSRRFLEVQEAYGTFDKYIWQFTDHQVIDNPLQSMAEYQATTPESDAMSKALKSSGFKFVGSTICYAFMQACGMVNDHLADCWVRSDPEYSNN